jgi:hypothetical protein
MQRRCYRRNIESIHRSPSYDHVSIPTFQCIPILILRPFSVLSSASSGCLSHSGLSRILSASSPPVPSGSNLASKGKLMQTRFGGCLVLNADAFHRVLGITPIFLAELSPPAFRSTFAGVTYQMGSMVSSASAQIEASGCLSSPSMTWLF